MIKAETKPTVDDALKAGIDYLNEDWPRNFMGLKRHDPNGQWKGFNIEANISKCPALQHSIDEMGDGYRALMMDKARIKLDIVQLEQQKPGKIRTVFSSQAKIALQVFHKAMEPLEDMFDKKQKELCRMNIQNFERLFKEVEASYDEDTRSKYGEQLGVQARKDAYLILGNMIRETVEVFDKAFRRYGVEGFGIPKNIEDPRHIT